MPPKAVICSICGEEVPKSQTVCIDSFSTPPKRACKKHEEALSKQEEIKTAEQQRIQKMVEPKPVRKPYHERLSEKMSSMREDQEKGFIRCICCGERSIYLRTYYEISWQMSVLLKDKISLLDPEWPFLVKECLRNMYGIIPKLVHQVKSDDIRNIKGKYDYRPVRDLLNVVPICLDCLKIHKHEHLLPKNEMNFDQLTAFSVASEIAGEELRKEFDKFKEENYGK